jgi:hypothetical protein
METQLELAADLEYLDKEQVRKLMEQGAEVARLINGLLASMSKVENGEERKANTASAANSARKGTER